MFDLRKVNSLERPAIDPAGFKIVEDHQLQMCES